MINVTKLSVSFDAIKALKDVSLGGDERQVICVLGANGAGKSTLIRTISGQCPIVSGAIEFDGRRIEHLSVEEVARLGVIQCPEGRQLFESLTVAENLRMGTSRLKMPWKRLKDDLDFVVELFPIISERWHQRALTLSGGEQQMVALARSVMARPRVLMLDEPSLGLAPKLVKQVFEQIPRVAKRGATVLLAEQNARAALKVACKGYVIQTGQVVKEGNSSELQEYLEQEGGYFGESCHTL